MSQMQKARAAVRKKRISKPLSQILSFFDESFSTPKWLQKKVTRRDALKSAAGATMVAAIPMRSWSASMSNRLEGALKTDPWLTLDAVLAHMLPESPTGPSAKEIQVTQYLYNVVFQQPTEEAEIEFIYKFIHLLPVFYPKTKVHLALQIFK